MLFVCHWICHSICPTLPIAKSLFCQSSQALTFLQQSRPVTVVRSLDCGPKGCRFDPCRQFFFFFWWCYIDAHIDCQRWLDMQWQMRMSNSCAASQVALTRKWVHSAIVHSSLGQAWTKILPSLCQACAKTLCYQGMGNKTGKCEVHFESIQTHFLFSKILHTNEASKIWARSANPEGAKRLSMQVQIKREGVKWPRIQVQSTKLKPCATHETRNGSKG